MKKYCPIGELVIPISTYNPQNNGSSTFEYVDISSVDRETKSIVETSEIDSQNAPSRARQLIKSGDILVSTVRPNLNAVAEVPEELNNAIASTGFTVLRPNLSKLSSRYLFNWVKSPFFITKMVENATGASYPAVSDRIVKESKIPLPPLDEQKRIAAVLDKADKVRGLRRQAIKKLDELLQSVFLDMFGDPVSNPKGWNQLPLNILCDNITDGTHDTPLRLTQGVPFITSKNVRPFQLDLSVLDFVSEETHEEIKKRCNPRFGDILYTNIGVNVGNAVANRLNFEFSLKNVALLQPNHTRLKPFFLESLLNNERLKKRILEDSSVGGAQKFVTLKFLRNTVVIVPPVELQTKYEKFIAQLDETKRQYNLFSDESKNLFHSLEQRAFTGELFEAAELATEAKAESLF